MFKKWLHGCHSLFSSSLGAKIFEASYSEKFHFNNKFKPPEEANLYGSVVFTSHFIFL